MNDFIEEYKNVLSEVDCDEFIKMGKQALRDAQIFTKFPKRSKSKQDDQSLVISPNIMYNIPDEIGVKILKVLKQAYEMYKSKYWPLDNLSNLWTRTIKFHWVKPYGGYHVWHAENQNTNTTNRVLVWHLALSSHQDEGDLEFLYYKRKLYPEKGKLILFPAYFSHIHRGNPIKTKDKYYITGWLDYTK